jgi:outer membrane protein TolC
MPTRLLGAVLVLVAISSHRPHAQSASADTQAFTLDQALQYALDHYPSMRAAQEQVNASMANVRVAQGAYWPRLDALWQTNRATTNNVFGQLLPQSVIPGLSGPVLPGTSMQGVWGSAAGALFSWEPVDLGLRGAVVRESEAATSSARASESLTRLSVQHAVGNAFLGLITAQQEVAAAESDLERRGLLARAAHALADNQLRPGAEASRADAELAAARTRAIRARQTRSVSQANLAQVLGVPAGLIDAVPGRLLEAMPADASPRSGAMLDHPLLRASQAAVDAASAQEVVLSKTDRPRLYLQSSLFARGSGANVDGSVDDGSGGLGLDRANWAAGVQIVFPNLLDFATLGARRAAAGAATRAEGARHDETVLTVTAQQRAADIAVEAARAIAQNTPVQLAAARQSEAQARARYEAGLTSIVEVADAQSLLAASEYQNAVARVEVWKALLAQAVALGRLDGFLELIRRTGAP